jgi:hypothetical protein
MNTMRNTKDNLVDSQFTRRYLVYFDQTKVVIDHSHPVNIIVSGGVSILKDTRFDS